MPPTAGGEGKSVDPRHVGVPQWERAKALARQQATESLRLQRLRDAMEGWAAAEAVRHFCKQLEQRWVGAGHHVDECVTWARYRASRIDPLVNPTLLANVDFNIEPQPADLEPFMGEWSLTYPGKVYRSTDTECASPDQTADGQGCSRAG